MDILVSNTYDGNSNLVPFALQDLLIGRSASCDITLDSQFVSREHARLLYRNKKLTLEALGMNGTTLNGKTLRIGEPADVEVGDRICIGEFVISPQVDRQSAKNLTYSSDTARKYLELQKRIHNSLLAKIRRHLTSNNLHSPEYVEQVNKSLSVLYDEVPLDLEPTVQEYIVKEAFKSAILDRLNLDDDSNRFRLQVYVDPRDEAVEREFLSINEAIHQRLAADQASSPDHEQWPLDKLDSEFHKLMREVRSDLTPGLKSYAVKRLLRKDLNDIIFGLGPLEDLLRIPAVTEIMVVSRDQIYIEKNGRIEESGRAFISDEVSLSIIERIVSPLGRRIDRSQPLVDARLPDGSRVNAVIPPLALKGPCITIRKFSKDPYTIDDLIEFGTLNRRVANFLRACVAGKKNLVVSGGTGTGKTTMLNVLSGFIPSNERIVTIEDSAELQLVQRHVVSLETKPTNIEGGGSFTIRDLVKNSLRMRPDRIVVGECRGGETLDMLQAMNTGHSGSMTTAHANSPSDMLLRLETMVLTAVSMPVSAIRSQIASAVDVIVQLNRFPNGTRCVTAITEIVAFDDEDGLIVTKDIFYYDGKDIIFSGYIPVFLPELIEKNYLKLEDIF